VPCGAVKRCPTSQKIWGRFLVRSVQLGQGYDFELIPTVKLETRLPVEGSFRNKFPSIYKHCGVMTA